MKKIVTLCAGLLLVFGLTACDENTDLPHPGEEEPDPEVTEPEPETGGDGGDEGDGGETQYVELELIEDEYTLTEGDAPVKLEYNVNPLEADVKVTSSNENTAIVTQDENDEWWITPVLAGYGESTLTVTASYEGYESDIRTTTVTVIEAEVPSVVTGIRFAEESYELTVGESKTFVYGEDVIIEGTGNYSTDFVLSVDTQYASVITIGSDGHTVTASSEVESATLTATATGGDVAGGVQPATTTISATSEVVAPEVTEIKFSAGTYEVDYGGTLDMSNAVTVKGNDTLTDTDFTLSCDTNEYISITDKVISGLKPTSTGITITATANADTSQTATATVTVSDSTNYVSSVSLSATNDTLYFSNSELDDSHPASTELSVSLVGTNGGTPDEDGYTITVNDESVVKYDDDTHTITAVASESHKDRSTTITATSVGLDGYQGNVVTSDPLTITVKYVETLVSSIELTKEEFDLRETETLTVGPNDVSGVDVGVTLCPSEADDKSFTVTPDEKLTVTGPDENDVYTIAAVSGHASEVGTLTIVPTSPKDKNVTAEIKVSILAEDYDYNYVTGLTLTGDAVSLQSGNSENNSFTLGPDGSDIVVGYTLTDPTEETGNKALEVTCESDYIQINANDTTCESFTITALDGANLDSKEPIEYALSITALGSKNQTVVTSYSFSVSRPDEYADDWTVIGDDNLKLDVPASGAPAIETSSLDLTSYLTVSVQNQYGETMDSDVSNGYTITSASGDITYNGTTITAVTGSSSGSATVTITSSDVVTDANKDKTLTITLDAVVYPVETITINGQTADVETVEWGESITPTIVVSPAYVTNNSYSVTSDLTNSEVGTYFTYNNGTFAHNKTHSGSETFTISALDDSGVTATLTITAEPEILEPQSASFDGLADTYEKGTVIYNLDSYLKVNFDEDSHQQGDFVDDTYTVEYTSSNTGVVTIDNDAKTATCVATGTAIITATITPEHDTENPISITTDNGAIINVKLTATEMAINKTEETLTEGDTLDLSVTFGPEGYTVTPDVTWAIESGGESYVSLSETTGDSITVTAESAGTAIVTASADGCTSVSCTVTVNAAPTFESYTLTISLKQSNGTSAFPSPYVDDQLTYHLYVNSAYDAVGTTWGTHELVYDSATDTYSYTYTTLPSSGTYTANIYASTSDTEDWDNFVYVDWFEWSVSGTEIGELTKSVTASNSSFNTWDDIFPELGDEESFYIVFWDNSGVSSWSETLVINCSKECFNGTTQSTATQTKTGDNKIAWYSEAGKLAENESDWFNMSDSNNSSKWMNAGTIEIPSNAQGTPVYCAGGWFSGWSGTYTANQEGSGWQFMPSGTTIAEFVASLTFPSSN